MTLRKLSCLAAALALASVAVLAAADAHALVTEPNGIQVPVLQPSPDYTEETLQDYFDSVGESIDAEAQASAEPGTFSPLCNFEATLVLSVSNASAGIAWYNVPADPTTPPAASELHHILLPSNQPDGTISSQAIRDDPAYLGGYIGFVLTKDFDNDPNTPPTAVYYSEYQRNALCTACATEGHWVMALVYGSSERSDTYYLAFEDWEGADASSWQGNDGDFNDKVFKLVGISCAGGGIPCQVPSEQGLCAEGLTECALDGGTPQCKPQYTAKPEVCDNIDNDCNGSVDDGALCPPNMLCVEGTCVIRCGTGEFFCPPSLACGDNGYCIDPLCVNVTCPEGLACRGGQCVNACSGIVCPLGQDCLDGVCQDRCAGVVCGEGSVCENGVCIGTCGCTECADGKVCAPNGHCVDPGCETMTCPSGTSCYGGSCVDVCSVAQCPGGAACVQGACEPAPPGTAGYGGLGSEGVGGFDVMVGEPGGAMSAAGTPGAGNGAGGDTSSSEGSNLQSSKKGCGCRLPSSQGSQPWTGIALGVLLLVVRRWRQR